jgi:PAS domain S-box-containing protein
MEAMRTQAMYHYSLSVVTLSDVLAIVLFFMSLGLKFFLGDDAPDRGLRNQGSALLRGAANPTMHYTAMAAVTFTRMTAVPDLSHSVSISTIGILGISIVPVMVLIVAILTSLGDRLQKQKALLDELFEQAPQAVVLMTADERIVRVNREFTHLFGYTPGEVLNRRLPDLIGIDEAKNQDQSDPAIAAHVQRVEEEGVRRRKDGSRLHVSIVRVPISMPGGQVEIYAIYRDIAERRRAEAALRDYADRLQALSRQLMEVQETERGHLARELHDEIGQMLTGLRLLLKPAGDLPDDADKARLEQARSIVDELVQRVRGLSFDLRPAALDHLGLLPALLALFERYTNQTGVLVNFKQERLDKRFSVEVETSAYRIVQEALTNVARHAGVKSVTVRVWATAETLNLQVEDRGRGFDPDVSLAAPGSSGLAGMHERVRLLKGILTIESSPGGGTYLTVEFPLRGDSGRHRDDNIHRPG